MFFRTRAETAAGLRALQKNICHYGGLPNRCDCKYGISGTSLAGSEQNGCCETSAAIRLVEAMTDAEYARLVRRIGGDLPFVPRRRRTAARTTP